MLLDLVEVAESHTGVNLGIAFVNVLKTFGVEEKVRSLNNYQMGSLIWIVRALQILSITGDNASNNDSMIKYLSDTIDDFPGPANQTRCFVHTINLIAKSILKPFDAQKTKGIGSFNDALSDLAEGPDLEECTEDTTHTTDEEEEEEEEEEAEADKDEEDNSEDEEGDDELDRNLEPIRSMLLKVCVRFILYKPKLISVESSCAKLRLRSRIQRLFSCQHGTRYCPPITFPPV